MLSYTNDRALVLGGLANAAKMRFLGRRVEGGDQLPAPRPKSTVLNDKPQIIDRNDHFLVACVCISPLKFAPDK